jgi:hypothetical protein
MATIKRIPRFDTIVSVTQTEEDNIATSITSNSTSFTGQLWNSTLNKIRIWNGSTFENEAETDDFLNPLRTVQQANTTFNGASKLVKLDVNGKLPAVDGSNLTNLPSTGGSNLSIVSAQTTFDFGNESNFVIKTISSGVITASNIKSFSVINIGTTVTSVDDFSLNLVTFTIENIIDNTSFDIRATAGNNASGVYTITYIITY